MFKMLLAQARSQIVFDLLLPFTSLAMGIAPLAEVVSLSGLLALLHASEFSADSKKKTIKQ